MKKILVINGHPDSESLCTELARSYKRGADKKGGDCKLVHLNELDFDPILHYGYRKRTELEPDLLKIQEKILIADHLVFVYPNWWGTYPALLKGFFDRVFLPKFAFKYRENSLFWDKLLTGKSARLIVTMDTPKWYYSLVYKSPGHNSIRKGILGFCGIKPVNVTSFGPVKLSDDKKRENWIRKVERLGENQK
ncbi:NAD(P)H-dependent oxidoreductase [Marinilabilia rubra]|uniref:NADPH:quinone reductase n=1 Tax=Marinilabilia rubra TaxID=2162893 RepID=A0A2U2B618_9BACT|nr:NAD(P)H-dependent oxidoreductase [Marinilabilia rubra]PWD98521.1 NADPH:quinone reductase [Marinilabilia rubra]